MNSSVSTDNSDSLEDFFIISSTNWNSFKKLYDKTLKRGYLAASEIKGHIDIHGSICGWGCCFFKGIF